MCTDGRTVADSNLPSDVDYDVLPVSANCTGFSSILGPTYLIWDIIVNANVGVYSDYMSCDSEGYFSLGGCVRYLGRNGNSSKGGSVSKYEDTPTLAYLYAKLLTLI